MARVHIAPLTAADEREFLAMTGAGRRHHRPWTHPPTDAAGFAALLGRGERDDTVPLLVRRDEDDAIVGAFVISQIFHGSFRSAYLGYYGSAEQAGRGYMGEGLALVLDHAFGPLRLHRIEANIQPGNVASLALVRRAGFRREGFSPRYLKIAGRWRDHERWAILAEEWERLRPPRGRGGSAGP